MQVVLAMFKSDGSRRSFSLHKEATVIGRREDCDLRIPLGEISRKHCRLIQDGETLRVEDMGSSNGTFHNGQRVQEATIQAGDTVQVGSIAFVVQIEGVPADEEMQPMLAVPPPETTSEDSGALAVSNEDSSADEHAESVSDSAAEHASAEISSDSEDFDPMAVLQGGDSEGSAGPIDIDLDESHHGQESEA
jgi:pSer/pThr/pTyr-binding forkhead associated (FHA) protein